MIKKYYFCKVMIIFSISCQAFAWDATGHELVAQIAFDNLTHATREKLYSFLNEPVEFAELNPYFNFQIAATWADAIKSHNITAFNSWHYIGIPYSTDNSTLPLISSPNVLWAIHQSEQILLNHHANSMQKARSLRFLIHFVGDIHQPLHCATKISHQFPQGDQGGNLFTIQTATTRNLHAFWDRGLGYFDKFFERYPPQNWQIKQLARNIENKYPKTKFAQRAEDQKPEDWARESYDLAKLIAYNIQEGTEPSADYIDKGQEIVQQQIALAGYRLANLLNNLAHYF